MKFIKTVRSSGVRQNELGKLLLILNRLIKYSVVWFKMG